MVLLKPAYNNRIFQHLLFWIVALLFWMFMMFVAASLKNILTFEVISLNILFNLSFAFSVYFNLGVLVPTLFKKKKFFLYSMSLILLITVSSLVLDLLLVYPLNSLVDGAPYFSEVSGVLIINFLFFNLVYVGGTTSMSLIREWFDLYRISLKVKQIEKDNLEAELKALKSQINPHFLFNSLNNIYSLALDRSDKTADLVLKLSEMMRYILYECNDRYVNLDKEISFIKNYIDLQKVRLGENIPIRLNVIGDFSNLKVAPLLFEPIIENAFKHGLLTSNSGNYVDIVFDLDQVGKLEFTVENVFDPDWVNQNDDCNGIGLSNVKRRLELLYPNNHELTVSSIGKVYTVNLKISFSELLN